MDRKGKALRYVALAASLALFSSLAAGQSMMKSAAPGAGGADSMSAPSSMGQTNALAPAGSSMADPKVGNMLRYAPSMGMKVIFTDLAAAESIAAKGPTVLFFAADWCPNCQADLRDINANGRRLGAVAVVVVNYDMAKDLEKKYAVTAQDTFVQIDRQGDKLAVWNGGGVDGILAGVAK
jgi:thioredoxin 1